METFAFPTTKPAQRPSLFIADQRLKFIATEQPAGDGFPDCKIAVLICAGEAFESLDDRRAALRASAKRLGVGHVLVRVKMLGFANDTLRQIADVAHERVAGELAMLDFAQAKFPLAGQLRAGQFGHRVFEKCDRLNGLRCRLQFLALSRQIMS